MKYSLELKVALITFIARKKLPANYLTIIDRIIFPLVTKILQQLQCKAASQRSLKKSSRNAFVLGISAPQGAGKSTIAEVMQLILKFMGVSSICLSLDDFYLTKDDRRNLSKRISLLLKTRGVPGTHDLNLILKALNKLQNHKRATIPKFDKLQDDRVKILYRKPADLIIFEGWCLGIKNYNRQELKKINRNLTQEELDIFNWDYAINDLEKLDLYQTWRNYVQQAITAYQQLFDKIDYMLYLQIPDFEMVFEWRKKQEMMLVNTSSIKNNKAMSDVKLKKFIAHYERLTKQLMLTMPYLANATLNLDKKHNITSLQFKEYKKY